MMADNHERLVMPSIRKLPPEEVRTIENKGKGQRKLTEEEYDRIIADFNVGEYGELTPDAGENRLTVRNRLKAAAKRRQLSVIFLRTRGEEIRFKVDGANGQGHHEPEVAVPAPEPAPAPVTPVAAPKRRGGRPKKNT
jgi:hypothetical protein